MAKTKVSYSQKSMEYLRKVGFSEVGKVEHWQATTWRVGNGSPGVRRDLYGIIDIVACGNEQLKICGIFGVLAVQAMPLTQLRPHLDKIFDGDKHEMALRNWLLDLGRFEMHCWRRLKVGNTVRWRVKIKEVILVGDKLEIIESEG